MRTTNKRRRDPLPLAWVVLIGDMGTGDVRRFEGSTFAGWCRFLRQYRAKLRQPDPFAAGAQVAADFVAGGCAQGGSWSGVQGSCPIACAFGEDARDGFADQLLSDMMFGPEQVGGACLHGVN